MAAWTPTQQAFVGSGGFHQGRGRPVTLFPSKMLLQGNETKGAASMARFPGGAPAVLTRFHGQGSDVGLGEGRNGTLSHLLTQIRAQPKAYGLSLFCSPLLVLHFSGGEKIQHPFLPNLSHYPGQSCWEKVWRYKA